MIMGNFKVVISDSKSRKAYQKDIEQSASGLVRKKIGERLPGSALGLQGYELEITGGSDSDGFPMRRDVEGIARKRILISSVPGFHPGIKGHRKRKSVRGNTISADITQVNTKVVKYGAEPLDKLFGSKPEPKTEKEEKPAEGSKEKTPEEHAKKEKPAGGKPEEEAKTEAMPAGEERPKESGPIPAEESKPAENTKEGRKPEEKMGVKEMESRAQDKKAESKPDEEDKEKAKK